MNVRNPFIQFIFSEEPDVFMLLNGSQQQIKLLSPHRNTMAAIFYEILLHNIGGSEKFENKQEFFFDQLVDYHKASPYGRKEVIVQVQRSNLLDSVSTGSNNIVLVF